MSRTPIASIIRTCIIVLGVVAGVRAAHAVEDAQTVPSRVTAVTVHLDYATVTREANAELTPGENRLLIKPLPATLDQESVRVRGRGAPGLVIRGVEVRLLHEAAEASMQTTGLENEIRDLTRRHALAVERMKSIGALREFVLGLKSAVVKGSANDLLPHGLATTEWELAFAFLSGHFDRLAEEEQGVEREFGDLSRRLESAQARLAETESRRAPKHFAVEILVGAKTSGMARLSVTYLVSAASWAPLYDARLDPVQGRVAIDTLGRIVQATGEDWKDVEVTLTTSKPGAGIDLPQLASVRLVDPGHGGRQGGMIQTTDGASTSSEFIDSLSVLGRNHQDVLNLESGAVAVDPEAKVEIQGAGDTEVTELSAETVRSDVIAVLALPGRLDIPSDGQPHQRLISSREIEARVEYQCVPALSPDIFVAARFTLPDDLPLLAGRMAHFVDGDLVGHSTVAQRSAGEELTLTFGPEARLHAERRETFLRISRRGRDEERDRKVVTTLRNFLGRPVTVHLSDRVPVSGDDRIDVTIERDDTTASLSPDPGEPGILRWDLAVPASGRADVNLRYRIRAPAGMLPAEH